jgi:O-antigen/teichoic acid export membrane protein
MGENTSSSKVSTNHDTTDSESLWKTIGFHRPMASFWYNYILVFVVALPMVFLNTWLLPNFILPYPSAMGFHSLTVTYFALFFSLMDMGTGPACERFVGQYSEVNPRKALKYIQFFVWFQMFTGTLQITIVAFFCFKFLIYTDLNYAMWFFLMYSTTQFPGMLGSYKFGLRGFQRFDKANIVEIVQTAFFEVFTQIAFIFLGRYFGSLNPVYGELFGATVGFILGRYVDDLFALFLSAKFLKDILKEFKISLWETIVPSFNKEEMKESLSFGFKLIWGIAFAELGDFITLLLMTQWLPGYVYILGYLQLSKSIADMVGTRYNYQPLISEAYNNGKKKLAEYSISSYFQNWWYLSFFLTIEIGFLVPPVLFRLGGEYAAAARILPLYILPRLAVIPPVMGAEILQGCNRPEYRTYGLVAEKITKLICIVIFLSPNGLVSIFGQRYLIELFIIHEIPPYLVITFVEFYFVHKKCVPLKISMWQTFVAGSLASIPLIPVNLLLISIFNHVWESSSDIIIPLILVGVFVVCIFLFFPPIMMFFYGLFGGWDRESLEDFRKCALISGPSKFITLFIYKAAAKGYAICPIKERFKVDRSEANRELAELIVLVNETLES